MKYTKKRWFCIFPVLYWAPGAFADYKSDIGYTDLKALLGANTPTGAGVYVLQAEASAVISIDTNYPVYAQDIINSQFVGKTFSFPGVASTSPSGHATGVGSLLYGSNSIAYGINNITSYEANARLGSLYHNTVSAPPNGSRIANHSWVGNGDTAAETGLILRLVDR